MSHADFLVEIGTEELPPKALLPLSLAFSESIAEGLRDAKLDFGEVRHYATPRRLAVTIDKLQLQAECQSGEVLGPPVAQAKDENGEWTAAANGFAKKQGVSVGDLDIVDTDKGQRLAYRSEAEGVRAADCLGDIINASVRSLPVPKRMRWGASLHEFVRPVHWVVALLGEDVIDCEVLGHKAGRLSRGHRFHGKGDISIDAPKNYSKLLEKAFVVASFEDRREQIRQQVNDLAKTVEASIRDSDDLLDEVTALVEWPVALMGSFEERFLDVPSEALIASMKEHQKYFPLWSKVGDKDKFTLLPRFITVSNLDSADPAQVVAGNERVIRPRLSDAEFFYNSDKERSLESRVEDLGGIVFQQKLGTMLDKTRRLEGLCEKLAEPTGADAKLAQRAAELSKADLLTLMVGEFPSMQGIAGRDYALAEVVKAEGTKDKAKQGTTKDDIDKVTIIADALEQQYWPKFAGDKLPENPVATCLALADRLDTIVGIFGIGQPPTGSKDPFALRRASLGVSRIDDEIKGVLRDAVEWTVDQYREQKVELLEDTVEQVMTYIEERIPARVEDKPKSAEAFNAVAAILDINRQFQKAVRQPADAMDPTRQINAAVKQWQKALENPSFKMAAMRLSMPWDIHKRVKLMQDFFNWNEAPALADINKRLANILDKHAANMVADVKLELLKEPAEWDLALLLKRYSGQQIAQSELEKMSQMGQSMYHGLEPESIFANLMEQGKYTKALKSLASLQVPVDKFFDEVMVMVDDEALRNNRLNLLWELRRLFLQVADISKGIVKKRTAHR